MHNYLGWAAERQANRERETPHAHPHTHIIHRGGALCRLYQGILVFLRCRPTDPLTDRPTDRPRHPRAFTSQAVRDLWVFLVTCCHAGPLSRSLSRFKLIQSGLALGAFWLFILSVNDRADRGRRGWFGFGSVFFPELAIGDNVGLLVSERIFVLGIFTHAISIFLPAETLDLGLGALTYY